MLFHLMQRSILMLLSLSCIWILKQRHGAFVIPLLLYLLGIFEQVFSSFQYCFTCGIREVNTFYTFFCPFKKLCWSLNLIFLWPLQTCSCCQPFQSSPNSITRTLHMGSCKEVPVCRHPKISFMICKIYEVFPVLVMRCSSI